MYCWKCGKELSEGSKFCSHCGAELSAAVPEGAFQKSPEAKRTDYRAFIVIGVIVLLILMAVTIVIGMVSSAEKAVPVPTPTAAVETATPTPTETPVPAPTATPRPKFVSPEQYAMENGLVWPGDEPADYELDYNSFMEQYSDDSSLYSIIGDTVSAWNENKPRNTNYNDLVRCYRNTYMAARADGQSDLEAHALALEETGIDKYILGEEEYTQFIYDSVIEAGVSDYDASRFAEQESMTWDTAWDAYKYSRDIGRNHERAIDSVKSRFNSDFSSRYTRVAEYERQGLSPNAIEEELFACLQFWYESDGNLETVAPEGILAEDRLEEFRAYQNAVHSSAGSGMSWEDAIASANAQYDTGVSSVPIQPENGKIFKMPSHKGDCPFSVSTDTAYSYYVYLEYQDAPLNSYDKRTSKGSSHLPQDDVAFFVRPGATVEIDVPVGVYKLYYATGETWYGVTELFGENTVYSSSDELLEFYTDSTTAYGNTLELWAQYGGNFETVLIAENEFPS